MMLIISPFFYMFMFFLYGSLWHFSLIAMTPYSAFEMQRAFVSHLYTYGLFSYFFVTIFLFWKTRIAKWVAIISFIFSLGIRVLDWNVFYYYGNHVDQLFWQFAFQGKQSSNMIFTKSSIISFFVGLVILAIFLLMMRSLEKYKEKFRGRKMIIKSTLVPLFIWCLFLVSLEGLSFATFKSSKSRRVNGRTYLAYVPEHIFLRSLYRFKFAREELSDQDLPSPDWAKYLDQRGLKVFSMGREYPLRKKSIYHSTKKVDVTRLKPGANIIMVIAESYSSYFVNQPKISPNINRLKKMGYSFDIFNAATPTFHGNVALLASNLYMYESTLNPGRKDEKELNSIFYAKSDSGWTRFEWISDILKKEGYENYYVHGSDGAFANLEDTLLRHNFDVVVTDRTSGLRSFAKKEKAHWGYSDDDLFGYTIKILKERDRSRPMFMVVDSADIHHPYQYHNKLDGVKDKVLNCAYSTDKAFGTLLDYYLKSDYSRDTILVFTADHAIFPTIPYIKLRPQFRSSYYDYTPFIAYVPGMDEKGYYSSIAGSSVDVAPTILDLIDLDVENSFLGLSLLSERANYPIIWAFKNLNPKYNPRGFSWGVEDQEKYLRFLKYLTYANRLVPSHAAVRQ